MANLSEIDRIILQNLMNDTRTSYRDIAEKLGVSHATVYNHVQKMIAEGIVKGYTLIIDHEKIGIKGTAYIGIELKNKNPERLIEILKNDRRVLEIHELYSPYDLMIKARADDMSQLKTDLVRKIAGEDVARIEVMMSLKTHKDDPRVYLEADTTPPPKKKSRRRKSYGWEDQTYGY